MITTYFIMFGIKDDSNTAAKHMIITQTPSDNASERVVRNLTSE